MGLLVEKILGPDETLPLSWPADGTTGYEALREIGGLFVDPRGEALVDAVTAEHTGVREGLSPTEHAARRLVTDEILVAEVRRIAALVPGDDDPEKVRDAVAELLCSFPVYRSYLPEGRVVAGPRGRHRGDGTPRARRDRPHDPRRHARRARRRADAPHRADQRDGHRQGRRGHHVLPLEPVRRAQRGRRGPRPLRRRAHRVPRPRRGPGRRDPGDHDHALDARHQALRGRPRAARRAQRAHRRVGRLPAHGVGAPSPPLAVAGAARLAVGARGVADHRGAPRGLPDEGLEGGEARHRARRRRARGRRGDRGLARAGARRPRGRRGDRGVRRRDRRARAVERAGPEAPAARRARCPRRLPGHRALRVLARRPRQPASRRLRPAPPAARAARRRLDALARGRRAGRARGGEARGHLGGAAPAALPPRAVHRLRAAARLRAGRVARRRVRPRGPGRSRAPRGRRHPSPGRAWRRPGAGATPSCPCPPPRTTGPTSSPAGPSTAPRPPWARSWTASRSRCWSARPDPRSRGQRRRVSEAGRPRGRPDRGSQFDLSGVSSVRPGARLSDSSGGTPERSIWRALSQR